MYTIPLIYGSLGHIFSLTDMNVNIINIWKM